MSRLGAGALSHLSQSADDLSGSPALTHPRQALLEDTHNNIIPRTASGPGMTIPSLENSVQSFRFTVLYIHSSFCGHIYNPVCQWAAGQ